MQNVNQASCGQNQNKLCSPHNLSFLGRFAAALNSNAAQLAHTLLTLLRSVNGNPSIYYQLYRELRVIEHIARRATEFQGQSHDSPFRHCDLAETVE